VRCEYLLLIWHLLWNWRRLRKKLDQARHVQELPDKCWLPTNSIEVRES
jgi:hypothetical protein